MAWQTTSIYGDGANGHHRFTLNITEDSTNNQTNQSYVSWSLVLSPLGNGWNWSYSNQIPVTYIVNINGVRCGEGNIMSYDGKSTVTVASGVGVPIQHNTDGYKDISFNFSIWSMSASYLPGAASASGTMSLTYIPRQATIISAPNFTDEENPKITYSNPAGNAVDKLGVCIVYYDAQGTEQRITINDAEGASGCYKFVDKTSSEYTFELTADERNNIYNATKYKNSLSVWFYVTTWIGSNTYHSTLQKTVTIVNSDPVIKSTTVTDDGTYSTELTGDGNRIISAHNYVKCVIDAEPRKGATIESKVVTCGNKSVSIENDYGILEYVESGDFIFTVTDSRGNVTTSEPIKKTFIPYFKPTCSISVSMLLDPENESQSKAEVTASGRYFSGDFGAVTNETLLWVRYKEQGGTYDPANWILILQRSTGNSYSEKCTISRLDPEKTYVFQGIIADSIYDNTDGEPEPPVESAEYIANTVPIYDYGPDSFNFNVPITVKDKDIKEVICPEPTTLLKTRLGSDDLNTNVKLNDSLSKFRTVEVLYSCNNWDHYIQSVRMSVGYRVGWNIGEQLGNILPCYDGTYIVFYFMDDNTLNITNTSGSNHIIAIYGWEY